MLTYGISLQDQQRRRSKRSTSISSTALLKGEKHEENEPSAPKVDSQDNKGCSAQVNPEIASRTLSSSHVSSASEKLRSISKDTCDSFIKLLSERGRTKMEERKSLPSFCTDSGEKSLKVSALHRHSGTGREKRERALKKSESWLSGHR